MAQIISNITLLVSDYDEAIDYYTQTLGFTLLCDVPVTSEQRWVRVTPAKAGEQNSGSALVLAKANHLQQHLIGQQAGVDVLLFLQTDDFWQDYPRMQAAGVKFIETPREEVYATVVVFEDLYGNRWDLLQPKP